MWRHLAEQINNQTLAAFAILLASRPKHTVLVEATSEISTGLPRASPEVGGRRGVMRQPTNNS